MPKRSTKGKVTPLRQQRDFNQMARAVVEHVERIADEEPGKNPAAVALGRRGGLKGGRARMESLSPTQASPCPPCQPQQSCNCNCDLASQPPAPCPRESSDVPTKDAGAREQGAKGGAVAS